MLRLGAKANEWVGMGRLIYAGLAAGYGGGRRPPVSPKPLDPRRLAMEMRGGELRLPQASATGSGRRTRGG